jgi:ferredoxin--NADP+ reductase
VTFKDCVTPSSRGFVFVTKNYLLSVLNHKVFPLATASLFSITMLNATLIKRIDITPELVVLRVEPDAGVPEFKAGQYVALGLPGAAPRPASFPAEDPAPDPTKVIKRAYSIGSSPTVRDYFEFYVAIVPAGSLTSRLAMLNEGDRLFCGPKVTGHFTLAPVPSSAHLIFVATGTGLAPFTSMMGLEETWVPGRTITLLHGVRHLEDLGYRDELEQLQEARGSSFRYIPFVSRAAPPASGLSGHVTRFFEERLAPYTPETHHILLCGNPAMIDAVEQVTVSQGFTVHSKKEAGNLHYEKYW